jgi:hypothetical protein
VYVAMKKKKNYSRIAAGTIPDYNFVPSTWRG